jgi:outer membrane protein
MKVLLRAFIGLAAAIPASAFAQTPSTQSATPTFQVGCFSPQRAFSESADGKAGIARLTALQDKKTREIAEKNKALQSQEQALQSSVTLLSEAARSQKTKELEKFRIDVQRFIQDAQAELTGAQRDMEGAFLVKLRPAIERVAKDKGLLLIVNLDSDFAVWAAPSLDITGDVLKQLARAELPPK